MDKTLNAQKHRRPALIAAAFGLALALTAGTLATGSADAAMDDGQFCVGSSGFDGKFTGQHGGKGCEESVAPEAPVDEWSSWDELSIGPSDRPLTEPVESGGAVMLLNLRAKEQTRVVFSVDGVELMTADYGDHALDSRGIVIGQTVKVPVTNLQWLAGATVKACYLVNGEAVDNCAEKRVGYWIR